MEIPARIHVLLAQNSPRAIVIRRGPSKRTAVIEWDRANDCFTVGQWLKGKIYPYRSDISSDGRHWIYFAMGVRGQTWTAVAKTPYLKALDFYPKGDAWNGGGLFAANKSYWLNEGKLTKHQCDRHTSGFSVLHQWKEHSKKHSNISGECPGVYFFRLERDGWTMADTIQSGESEHTTKFFKRINDHWCLYKLFHAGLNPPVGKGNYYESHRLCHTKNGDEIDLPDAEWADVDKNRFLWSEQGKIMSDHVSRNGLENRRELTDLNPLEFTESIAPY